MIRGIISANENCLPNGINSLALYFTRVANIRQMLVRYLALLCYFKVTNTSIAEFHV